MAELSLRCQDFSLVVDRRIAIAALRYMDAASVVGLLQDVAGLGLPGTNQALCSEERQASTPQVPTPQVPTPQVPRTHVAAPQATVAQWLLAWRSPTETLVLATDSTLLEALASRLAGATDACLVDQSGGIWVLRLTGSRVADVLVRLGSTTAIPAVGQSLTSRLAELTVTAVRVQEGEILLLVDRFYADHLLGWIRETIADF